MTDACFLDAVEPAAETGYHALAGPTPVPETSARTRHEEERSGVTSESLPPLMPSPVAEQSAPGSKHLALATGRAG